MTFDEFWKNERMVATSYRNAAKAAWNEARRTDPVKVQMIEALKEAEQVIDPIRFGGALYLVSKTIKAAEEES
jgi:hypothetical protein